MKTTTTKSLILSATALLTAMAFTSCSKESELDTIKDAQMCLNDAAPSGAQACVSKLSGINTDQANQLKCAAYFIEEGYGTPTKLIDAIEAAENNSGSSSSMNMISELAFLDANNASEAFDVCNDSGIAVYSQLSSLVQISTLAKGFNNNASTPADYEAAVVQIPSTVLGQLVNTTYQSSCSGTSASGEALSEYCTELGEVLAGADADDIGDCLKEKLTGNNVAGCSLF